MWTPELIDRLQKYVNASRKYEVYYQSHKVYGMDPPVENYPASVYLEPYDDVPPDAFVNLDETNPNEFTVYSRWKTDWEADDPKQALLILFAKGRQISANISSELYDLLDNYLKKQAKAENTSGSRVLSKFFERHQDELQ